MVENNELPDDPKRRTATRKATVVIEIIKARITASEVARTYDLTVLGRDLLDMHLADLRAYGKVMTKSQLCRVLEILRKTAYYKPRSKRHNDEVDEELCKQ